MKNYIQKLTAAFLLLALFASMMAVAPFAAEAAQEDTAPAIVSHSNVTIQTEPISITGNTYDDAIVYSMGYTGKSTGKRAQVTYNLKGRYKTLTFDVGFYGGEERNAQLLISADGLDFYTADLSYTALTKTHTVDVEGVSKLIVRIISDGYDKTKYAIGDIQFTPVGEIAKDPVLVSDEFYDICRYQFQNAKVLTETFSMGGYEYQNGYHMSCGYTGKSNGKTSKVYFNFNGQYKEISFDIARYMSNLTSSDTRSGYLTIELDGVAMENYTDLHMYWDDISLPVTVDIEGVNQMVVSVTSDGYDKVYWAMGNIQLVSDGRAHGVLLSTNKATLTTSAPNVELNPRVYPSDAVNKNFTVTADPAGIVIPQADGTILGRSGGSATVTVTTEDGGHTATCAITSKLPDAKDVYRVYGNDRYQTAFASADTLKEVLGIEKFNAIVVACGTNFPDALAGTYLAAQKNAPILLVKGNNVNTVNTYIQNNLASGGTLYLLGDAGVVPNSVGNGISGITVKRLGGATRYDTNLKILEEAGISGKNIIVCTGQNFADSLSASATGLPILLVKSSLNENQKEFLEGRSCNFIIIGGTNAVNATVEKQLKTFGTVKRLAGNTRYESSILVAQEFFKTPKKAVLAYAQNFPDGLSGGPLAYNLKAPLLLTATGKHGAAMEYTKDLGIEEGYVMGGTSLINDATVRKVFAMADGSIILEKK